MNYKFRIPAVGSSPFSGINQFIQSRVNASIVPKSIIRYVYYAFIFSLPFESAGVEIGGLQIARMLGFILAAVILAIKTLRPSRLEFAFPPKAFWCFVAYFIVYITLGLNTIWSFPLEPVLADMFIQGIKTFVQLFILLWISYNLLQYERIKHGSMVALAASCVIVAALQISGLEADTKYQDRRAAFDADPNGIAAILALGLLILVAYSYDRGKFALKTRLVFGLSIAGLAGAIVVTGSRGGILAAVIGSFALFSQGKSLASKLKIGLISLIAIACLGLMSYKIESVRERWENTYATGDTAGRDLIFLASWEMFLEKPLTGWGPANHLYELGSRVRWPTGLRDTHNVILWILTESGLLGAIPFFAGLLFCWCAAWRARRGIDGALPMSLLVCVFFFGMTVTNHATKLFWFVLANALASGNYISPAKPGERQARSVAANRHLANLSSLS